MKYHQGTYKPHNPQKYAGDPDKIFWRSSWERKVMKFLDCHTGVLKWNSEEIKIPYYWAVDEKMHRYFVDFAAQFKGKDGKVQTVLIEVKPFKQTQEPKAPKRKTKHYIRECVEWTKNQAKWAAAREYCKERGWQFVILTEKELNV